MCPYSHVYAEGKWHTDENGVPFSSDTFCVNLPERVEGAGVPVDRRAACMDMHDSK
jgi:hypothetical protein